MSMGRKTPEVPTRVVTRPRGRRAIALAVGAFLAGGSAALAQERLLGVDVSDWQQEDVNGVPLQPVDWNLVHLPVSQGGGGKDFAFIRATRGGTTGTYNKYSGVGTLSQRYDDYRFVENITNATSAGMFAGGYHFAKADISTNTGADEADHMFEIAGAWMKPGYLRPTFDMEAGDAARTTTQLSQYCVEFSNRILELTGVTPFIYINQNYALNEIDSTVAAAMPDNWVARWPNQTYADAIDTQNIDPIPSPITANVYGVWNPSYPAVATPEPWKVWQYNSRGSNIPGLLGNSGGLTDLDVAHGDIEFMRDQLVPALVTNNVGGDWSTQSLWNSDNPDYDANDLTKGPAPRLPNGIDTVILDRGAADPTIILSTGAHTIRKLIIREQLNITGGSLTVGYIPKAAAGGNIGAGPISAQFSHDVTMSGGSLSVHTLQVDAAQTFNVSAGNLIFNTLNLLSHAATPAKILMGGDASISALSGGTATINSTGGLALGGSIDLGGAARTFTVADGAAEQDFVVNVALTNGGLIKAGAGTMVLNAVNSFTAGTTISAGTLISTPVNLSGNITNNAALIFDHDSAASYSNSISGGGAFTKRGAGMLTMTAGNALSGAVTINDSVLRLEGANGTLASASGYSVNAATLAIKNDSGNNNNRLSNGAVSLNSGTIDFVAASTIETAGNLSASSGASTVALSGTGTSALNFGALNRAAGSTLNFTGVNGTMRTTFISGVTAGSFIDQGTFVEGGDYGVYDAGGFVRAMASGAGPNDYATSVVADRHVKLSASAAGLASQSIKTLNIAQPSIAAGLAGGTSLTIAQGGLIKSSGGVSSIDGPSGSTLVAPSNVEYVVSTASASDQLNITTGISGGAGLTKTGAGTLSLQGAGNYGGPTAIVSGTLIAGTANLGKGDLIFSGGGTLRTSSGLNTGRTVALNAGGGVFDTNSLSSTMYGDMAGAGGLTKAGAGTLTINGAASTYSGPTTLTGGTLLAGAGDLGDGTLSNRLIFNAGTLKTLGSINTNRAITLSTFSGGFDTNGYDSSFTGVISGVGGFSKAGVGTLTLTNPANSFDGNVFINAGTVVAGNVQLGNSGVGNPLYISNGARWRLPENLTSTRLITINSSGGVIDTDGYAATLSGTNFVGSGPFTKAGFGSLSLTTASPHFSAITVNNGTLRLTGASGTLQFSSGYTVNPGGILFLGNTGANNNNRISDTALVSMNGGTLWLQGNATTETAGNLSLASGASQIVFSGTGTSTLAMGSYSRTPGASLNFIGAGSSFKASFTSGVSSGNFIDQGTFVGGNYAVYDAAGYVRAMAAGVGDQGFVTTVSANSHVKLSATPANIASNSIYTLNLAGTGSVSVSPNVASSATLTLAKGGILSVGAAGNTIGQGNSTSNITTAVEYVINPVAADDLLTISVKLLGGTGLTKTGLGRLSLNNASNNYGGNTIVSQGTLRLATNNVIPNSSNLAIGSGAQFDMNGKTETVGNLTLGDARIFSLATAATLTLNGASPSITYNGLNTGATVTSSAIGLGTSAGTTSINVADGDAAADLSFTANLIDGTGAHGITKLGAGTLQLRGAANNFSGGVVISAGTLQVDGALSAAAGTVDVGAAGTLGGSGSLAKATTLSGGTTDFASGGVISNSLTINGGLWRGLGSVSGAATVASGTFTVGADANLTTVSGLTVSGGTLASSSATATITGDVTYASPLSSTWGGNIAGAGKTLTINNAAGVLRLTGNNTYSGVTTITAGTLEAGASKNLGDGSAGNDIIFNGGQLRTVEGSGINLPQNDVQILAGGGTVDTNQLSATLGNVTGNGALIVKGAGTLAANYFRTGTLEIKGNATAQVALSNVENSGTSKVNQVVVEAGARLDLKNNDLIVTSMNYSDVELLVKSGYGNFDWLGSGITSSTAATTSKRMLGIVDNSTAHYTTFSGQSVSDPDTLVKYTYLGDANLDGLVTPDDFTLFVTGISGGPSKAKWGFGDFDYNGFVNPDDFTSFVNGLGAFNAANGQQLSEEFKAHLAAFASGEGLPLVLDPAPVPEPTMLGIFGFACAAILTRRRYRH